MQVFHGHGGSVKSVSCRPADRHLSLSLSLSPNPNPNPNPDPNPNPNPNPNQAAAQLLSDPLVLQHAPLLSPVLPEPIKDNQWTKQLSGEARKEATIHVMARVLELKLGGAPH